MEKIKKIWKYIKSNKIYLAIMFIGTFLLAMQMKEVVLYADDFSLGIISQGGLKSIITYFKNNYMNWGGGLTCLIATTFLMFRIGVWKVFHCILIVTTVVLATRMITYNNKRNKALVASIIWLCIFILSIYVSREVMYWLDGALAYEFTAFQIFIYFYYLYTRMNLKINKKYDKILLPVVAFFAGWSSAQTGPLVLVIPIILMLWQKFIKKEKIFKFYYFTTIIGVIGFAIFYFAPGNAARMNIAFEEYASFNLIQKIVYRSEAVYGLIFDFERYEFTSIPFYMLVTIGLSSLVGLKLFNTEENKKKKTIVMITSIIQLIFVFICLGISLKIPYSNILATHTISFENLLQVNRENRLTFKIFMPYITATIVMISIVIESYMIGLKTKDPFLVTTLISAFIMQGVMVMAPYSPLRTTYYTIMFLWFAIAYLIKLSCENKIRLAMITILVFTMYNLQLGIMAVLIYFIVNTILKNLDKKFNYKYELAIIIGLMLITSWGNYTETIENYRINKEIYNQNISRIEKFKDSKKNGSKSKELYLLLPKNETYGFTPMVGIEWVEKDIKKYFEIDDEVVLKAEVEE